MKNRKSVRTDPKKSASGKAKAGRISAKYVRKTRKTENQYVQNRKSQFQGNRKKGEVLQNTYGKREKQEISTYRPGKVSFREAESREKFCKIRTESTKNRESVRTDPKKSASGKQKKEESSAKYVRKARKTGNQYVQLENMVISCPVGQKLQQFRAESVCRGRYQHDTHSERNNEHARLMKK